MNFWRFLAHRPAAERDARAAGQALRKLHEAFDGYAGDLPPFTDHMVRAGELLDDEEQLPRLLPEDRSFLQAVRDEIAGEIADAEMVSRPLHGEPHLGNALVTRDGVRFIDLEASCCGPAEWDVGYLPAAAAPFFETDWRLAALLGRVRSLCVAVWCWAQPERAPEVAEAADVHLRLLRGETLDS